MEQTDGLIIEPDEETMKEYQAKKQEYLQSRSFCALRRKETVSLDGQK